MKTTQIIACLLFFTFVFGLNAADTNPTPATATAAVQPATEPNPTVVPPGASDISIAIAAAASKPDATPDEIAEAVKVLVRKAATEGIPRDAVLKAVNDEVKKATPEAKQGEVVKSFMDEYDSVAAAKANAATPAANPPVPGASKPTQRRVVVPFLGTEEVDASTGASNFVNTDPQVKRTGVIQSPGSKEIFLLVWGVAEGQVNSPSSRGQGVDAVISPTKGDRAGKRPNVLPPLEYEGWKFIDVSQASLHLNPTKVQPGIDAGVRFWGICSPEYFESAVKPSLQSSEYDDKGQL